MPSHKKTQRARRARRTQQRRTRKQRGGKRRRGIVSQLCEGVTKYIAAQDIHIRIGMEQDLQLDVKCMMVPRRSVCLKSLVGNDLLTPIRHATL